MLTTVCTLRQGDRHATARLSTPSPQESGVVEYDGDVDLFPTRTERLRNDVLRFLARSAALTGGVEVQVEESGTYDWLAK